jgi:hypothetical protein
LIIQSYNNKFKQDSATQLAFAAQLSSTTQPASVAQYASTIQPAPTAQPISAAQPLTKIQNRQNPPVTAKKTPLELFEMSCGLDNSENKIQQKKGINYQARN